MEEEDSIRNELRADDVLLLFKNFSPLAMRPLEISKSFNLISFGNHDTR